MANNHNRVDRNLPPYNGERVKRIMQLTPKDAIQDPGLSKDEREIVALHTLNAVKEQERQGRQGVLNAFSMLNPAHLKMHLAKQAVNYFLPRTAGVLPDVKPTHDVNKLLDRVADRITTLADKAGVSIDGVHWDQNVLSNFINDTKAGSKILIFIGEHDPHYLRWSMILTWYIWDEMEKMRREDPQGFNMFQILANALPREDEK